MRFLPCTVQVPTLKIFSNCSPTLTNTANLRYTVLHKPVTHNRLSWTVWLKTSNDSSNRTSDDSTGGVSVMLRPFNQGAVLAIPSKNFKQHLIIYSPVVKHVWESFLIHTLNMRWGVYYIYYVRKCKALTFPCVWVRFSVEFVVLS